MAPSILVKAKEEGLAQANEMVLKLTSKLLKTQSFLNLRKELPSEEGLLITLKDGKAKTLCLLTEEHQTCCNKSSK